MQNTQVTNVKWTALSNQLPFAVCRSDVTAKQASLLWLLSDGPNKVDFLCIKNFLPQCLRIRGE